MITTILESFDIWTRSQTIKSNGRTAGVNNQRLLGIDKLRELILELAVRGKLVPQDEKDEPASILLKKILEKTGKTRKNINSEAESLFSIPKSWERVIFEEITYQITDGTHHTPLYLNEGIPFLSVKDMSSGVLDFSKTRFISQEQHSELIKRCNPQKGDLLLTKVGTTGIPIVIETDISFSIFVSVALIKFPQDHISGKFLSLQIKSPFVKIQSEQATEGIGNKNLVLRKIEKFNLILPPLAEQHRIVAKVDELMALCDQLEQQQTESNATHHQLVELLLQNLTEASGPEAFATAWQRIATNFDTLFTTEYSIDQLKQTILQLAVMGKLVTQDPKDEPASELLKKIGKEKDRLLKEGKIKKQEKLPLVNDEDYLLEYPESWTLERLGKIANVGTGATPIKDKSAYYFPKEINWVTSGETSNDFIYQTAEKISCLALKETNVTVYPPGTLIIAMYGQGKTRGQISELMIEAGTNQACAAIQLINSDINHKKYIKYFFKKSYDEIREQSAGGAQPNLNVGKITNTIIPIPPLAEQHRIVTKVDELFALCDALKERIKEAQETQGKLAEGVVEGVLKTEVILKE